MVHKSIDIHEARSILEEKWGYKNFRPKQAEVINALTQNMQVVALLPTGGGKSICYQIPALLLPGLTIVVSPLIALMEDQVSRLKKIGISADTIHSGRDSKAADRILDNCRFGDIKLLYVSPERLQNELFRARLKYLDVSLIAIDEAHCISQWGHNFRPSYLNISSFIADFRSAMIIAVTGSATAAVLAEIKKELALESAPVIRDSFLRDNLEVSIVFKEDSIGSAIQYLKKAQGQIIVYIRSRRKVQMFADNLQEVGLDAHYFHAGLKHKEKVKIREAFVNGKIRIIVATNAFGMGIDISSIRHVVHIGISPSIEEYYQEIGRAGRDGHKSKVVSFVNKADLVNIKENYLYGFPDFSLLSKFTKRLYVFYNIEVHSGVGHSVRLNYSKLMRHFKLNARQLYGYLNLLSALGLIEIAEEDRDKTFIKIDALPHEIRDVIRNNEKEHRVLDRLIRSYELIFDNWIQVDAIHLSKVGKFDEEGLFEYLKSLRKDKLISVFVQDAGPRLLMLKNRESNSFFDQYQSKYQFLKNQKLHLLTSVTQLIMQDGCRNKVILNYFEEDANDQCFHCDNCVADGLSTVKAENLNQELIQKFINGESQSNNRELLRKIQRKYNESAQLN